MGWLLHDSSPPPTPPWGPEAQLPKWRGEGGPVLNPQGFGEANVYAEALVVKNLPVNAGNIRDTGSVPGSERSPGIGNGNSLW